MKIALISGSRSDRNALVMVEKALNAAGHNTLPMELGAKGLAPVANSQMALAQASVYLDAKPDLVVVHGDRSEILAASFICNLTGIPIAHIGGGDITEGSQDDCFRHAITKLSHLHFASNQDSADRIVQMGEEPERVHVTGCPGIDMVMATETLGKVETLAAVGLGRDWRQKYILVLFHPNTLGDTRSELEALSAALARRTEALVLLGPNNDAGARLIFDEWHRLANHRQDTVCHDNVEPKVFYSLLKWCDVLVGNSSAGYYEAPYFDTKVLDLGDRQCGRIRPFNVRQESHFDPGVISEHISLAMSRHPWVGGLTGNLYGDGHAAERIAAVIGGIEDSRGLLRKKFRACPKLSGGYCSLDEKLS